jgi:cytoskeleton protein RodZ
MSIDFDLTHDTGQDPDHPSEQPLLDTIGAPVSAPEHLVEVRRRAGLAVGLGGGASLVAVAYLARASGGGGALDWALFVVLGLIGAANLTALLDARTPLLVADELGVRLRLSRTWVGLPWGGLAEVEHRPRRGRWRDGLLVVHTHYVQRILEDLDPPARRTARINARLHRTPLAVPLGLGTRVIGADPDLVSALRALAGGRTPVVEHPAAAAVAEPPAVTDLDVDVEPVVEHPAPAVVADPPAVTDLDVDVEPVVEHPAPAVVADLPAVTDLDVDVELVVEHPAPAVVADLLAATDLDVDVEGMVADEAHPPPVRTRPALPDPRPAVAALIGRVAAALERPTRDDAEVSDEPDVIQPSLTPPPARETVRAARAEVRHESHAHLDEVLEDDSQVWEALQATPEIEGPVLIDDHLGEPPAEPVIGPQFAGARRRLGLTVDELADRTRIRPHVIEAIEADDFTACGGDFYARGHLRTLARVLGVEAAPILETYDERYADAPIDPRRVFEAELAGAGSIRATRGGPNWSVLVAAVMALILCWSVARLVTGGPDQTPDRAVLSGSGGPDHSSAPAAKPVPVTLTAAGGGARLVVRDASGKVAFSGDLSFGQEHTVQASPPVRVQSTDGSVRVSVNGQDRGRMGPSGRPATKLYVARR